MTERDYQGRLMDAARALGWMAFHFHDSRRQVKPGVYVGDRDAAGFPDLVLVHERHGVLFREVKSDTGRVSAQQAFVIEELRRAGQDAAVWRPRDWDEACLQLRGIKTAAGVSDPLPTPAAAPTPTRRTP